jgi:pyrroline-5-carboxylate reductase
MKVTFLGGGNMASALIGGMLAKGFAPADIAVVELAAEGREKLFERYGVHAVAAPDDRCLGADALVLAVKPQDLRAAAAPFASMAGRCLVISIAAGIRLRDLSRWLGDAGRVVRCMPNTPALIGAGITGLFAPASVGGEDRARAERILGAVGETVWVADESLLDPVTALSGSGPAYVFWFIEQLAAGGAALGLDAATASKLALHTVLGAAKLAAQSDEPPGVLRERVTSKGGTTAAALAEFAKADLAGSLHRAMAAASRRGAELGDELGRD